MIAGFRAVPVLGRLEAESAADFAVAQNAWVIGSECGDALNDPEHRHAADGIGRQKLDDGQSLLVDGGES